MAPSLEVQYQESTTTTLPLKKPSAISSYIPGRTVVEKHDTYEYEDLKPSFPIKRWAPLEEVPYEDKGVLGDPSFKNILAEATNIFDYNTKIGTEVHGVDVANLSDAAKNDLALLISQRGVVSNFLIL